MKICFLANSQSIHTHRWISYFAGRGHEVHLVTINKGLREPIAHLTLHEIDPVIRREIWGVSFFLNTIGSIIRTRAIIKNIGPDIVHAHFLTDYGLIGFFSRFDPLVVTPWGTDLLVITRHSLFYRFMAELTLNFARVITCNSEALREECRKYCRDMEKIKIIQWGVDLRMCGNEGRARPTDTPARMISTRSFRPVYNIDIIVRAVPLVLETHPEARFVLKNADGKADPRICGLAESLGVQDTIEFVDREIPEDEMGGFLRSAGVFISVPSSDSSSSSLLEAMACGLPVIVSDLPANREWVTDGYNGFIVPARDHERLAASVIRCIEDPALMRIFGERNMQIVREKADREKHMARMENIYMRLASSDERRSREN